MVPNHNSSYVVYGTQVDHNGQWEDGDRKLVHAGDGNTVVVQDNYDDGHAGGALPFYGAKNYPISVLESHWE